MNNHQHMHVATQLLGKTTRHKEAQINKYDRLQTAHKDIIKSEEYGPINNGLEKE